MEENLNLERLPPEVLWHIGIYLRIPDLTACCGASSRMRQAFSDDLVWKKHCDLESVNYLNEAECTVEPNLEWTELWYQSSLPSLPHWRSSYMKNVNLFRNWTEGRFEKEEIQLGTEGSTFSDTKVIFYRGDHLVVHAFSCTQCTLLDEVWDVRDTPFLHSSLKLNQCLSNNQLNDPHNVHTFIRMSNKLVVSEDNLALVFDIDLTNFSQPALNFAFILNKTEEFCKTALSIVNNSVIRNSFFEVHPEVQVTTSEDLFIGALTSVDAFTDPRLHIWDILKESKIKEECIPTSGGVIVSLEFLTSLEHDDFVIKLRVNKHRYMYHYYGYDRTKLSYSSFSVQLNYCDFVFLAANHVVGVAPRQVILYDYENSEKAFVKKCDHEVLKKTVTVVGEDLLFGTFDSVIHVVNLKSLTVINSVKLGFTLYSLTAICNRFVVINSNHSEVWEIKKRAKKLFNFPIDGSIVAVNRYCTKIAIDKGYKIIILNFW